MWGVVPNYMGSSGKDFGLQHFVKNILTPSIRSTTTSPHIHAHKIILKKWVRADMGFLFLAWGHRQIKKSNNHSQMWGVVPNYMRSSGKDFGLQHFVKNILTPSIRSTTTSPHIHAHKIKLKCVRADMGFVFLAWRHRQIKKSNNPSQMWGVIANYMGSSDTNFGLHNFVKYLLINK